MSTLPMPLLSLLRKFISDISIKRRNPRDSPGRTHGVFTSLLRAAAIPSLGYLFGWNSRLKTVSISSDANLSQTGGGERMPDKGEGAGRAGSNKRPKKRNSEDPKTENGQQYDPDSPIYQLMNNLMLHDPTRRPRNPIVLSHGLYGFDVRGISGWPNLQIHYWSEVLQILRKKVGAEVIVTKAPSTGSIQERGKKMHEFLKQEVNGRELNFLAHSMGGLDCRHIISNIKPTEYKPLSLTTVCTPHRGSPFMDWLKEYIGIGESRIPLPGIPSTSPVLPLPSSIVSFIDSPAYSNLTSNYLQFHFNPATPDSPDVKYWSVAARTPGVSFFHPLWLPKLLVDAYEEKQMQSPDGPYIGKQYGNDCLVPVESAKWGEFLGVLEDCDHWDIRGAGGLSAHYADEIKEKSDSKAQDNAWSWNDWQKFLGTWNRDKSRRDATTSAEKEVLEETLASMERREKAELVAKLEDPNTKQNVLDAKSADNTKSDSGTSAMDQVLDWVVENVPGIGAVKAPLKAAAGRTVALGSEREGEKASEERPKPPKFDLEKFYIALCRKLYNEGL